MKIHTTTAKKKNLQSTRYEKGRTSKTFRSQPCRERRGTPRIRTGDPQVFRTPTCQLGYGGFWCSYAVLRIYEPQRLVAMQATTHPPTYVVNNM
jgi:hypothetical protein